MVSMSALVLPILVSAVFVFIVSSILHMALTYHQKDYSKLPAEDAFMDALREVAPPPGFYFFPHCNHKDMAKPEVQAKFQRGPVGMMTVIPSGLPKMGSHLILWFLFSILVSFVSAAVAAQSLGASAAYPLVFQATALCAFLGYGASHISDSIWKAQPWGNTARALVDGLIYALTTAATMGWLWPK
jgi:hypothetical protein